jgi:hypothetical protein
MSVWISALKEYNEKKGMWCMPKKGTAEHAEVMKIMDKMKGSKTEKPVAEKPVKTSKVKAEPVAVAKTSKVKTEVKVEAKVEAKPKKTPKRKVVESDSESDVPVAKPKVRAEPVAVAKTPKAKTKSSKMVFKGEKFVPEMMTAKEKEDRAEKMELEMMAEDFKAGSPLKKKTSGKK